MCILLCQVASLNWSLSCFNDYLSGLVHKILIPKLVLYNIHNGVFINMDQQYKKCSSPKITTYVSAVCTATKFFIQIDNFCFC